MNNDKDAVSLVVYDVSGKIVKDLVRGNLGTGIYEVDFDGSNLPSGAYFYKLDSDNFSKTNKMLLLK